jgi:hypothetical protein
MNDEMLQRMTEANGLVKSDISKEIAKIQGKMFLARQFPRDIEKCMEKITNACKIPAIAEDSNYIYNRGGTEIFGASIRLMEIIAQNWGNVDFGIRELSRNENESELQAFAWDLETNVSQELTFTVGHTRYSKSGGLQDLIDPRDIYEAISNYGTRRMRKCMESVIPVYVVKKALEICDDTLREEIKDIEKAKKDLVKVFLKFSVTKPHIEEKMNCRIDRLKPTQILRLRRIYKSIVDGIGKPSDFFTVSKTVDKTAQSEVDKIAKMNEKLKNKDTQPETVDQEMIVDEPEIKENQEIKPITETQKQQIEDFKKQEDDWSIKLNRKELEEWIFDTNNIDNMTFEGAENWLNFLKRLDDDKADRG